MGNACTSTQGMESAPRSLCDFVIRVDSSGLTEYLSKIRDSSEINTFCKRCEDYHLLLLLSHDNCLNGHRNYDAIYSCLELLLRHGANANVSYQDYSPLARAITFGMFCRGSAEFKKFKLECIQLLLKYNADPNFKNKDQYHVFEMARDFFPAAIPLLIEAGVDVNWQNKQGNTLLMSLIQQSRKSSHYEHWLYLLFTRSEQNLKNQDKNINDMKNQDEHVCVVKRSNSKPNLELRNNLGRTTLMIAVVDGTEYCVQLLLFNGANVNAQDNNGHTALALAVFQSCYASLIIFLLNHGADKIVKTYHGVSVADIVTNVVQNFQKQSVLLKV